MGMVCTRAFRHCWARTSDHRPAPKSITRIFFCVALLDSVFSSIAITVTLWADLMLISLGFDLQDTISQSHRFFLGGKKRGLMLTDPRGRDRLGTETWVCSCPTDTSPGFLQGMVLEQGSKAALEMELQILTQKHMRKPSLSQPPLVRTRRQDAEAEKKGPSPPKQLIQIWLYFGHFPNILLSLSSCLNWDLILGMHPRSKNIQIQREKHWMSHQKSKLKSLRMHFNYA